MTTSGSSEWQKANECKGRAQAPPGECLPDAEREAGDWPGAWAANCFEAIIDCDVIGALGALAGGRRGRRRVVTLGCCCASALLLYVQLRQQAGSWAHPWVEGEVTEAVALAPPPPTTTPPTATATATLHFTTTTTMRAEFGVLDTVLVDAAIKAVAERPVQNCSGNCHIGCRGTVEIGAHQGTDCGAVWTQQPCGTDCQKWCEGAPGCTLVEDGAAPPLLPPPPLSPPPPPHPHPHPPAPASAQCVGIVSHGQFIGQDCADAAATMQPDQVPKWCKSVGSCKWVSQLEKPLTPAGPQTPIPICNAGPICNCDGTTCYSCSMCRCSNCDACAKTNCTATNQCSICRQNQPKPPSPHPTGGPTAASARCIGVVGDGKFKGEYCSDAARSMALGQVPDWCKAVKGCTLSYTTSMLSRTLCTGGLTIEHSPTVCKGLTADRCVYSCDTGYAPRVQSGLVPVSHVCEPDGTFVGGSCVKRTPSAPGMVAKSVAGQYWYWDSEKDGQFVRFLAGGTFQSRGCSSGGSWKQDGDSLEIVFCLESSDPTEAGNSTGIISACETARTCKMVVTLPDGKEIRVGYSPQLPIFMLPLAYDHSGGTPKYSDKPPLQLPSDLRTVDSEVKVKWLLYLALVYGHTFTEQQVASVRLDTFDILFSDKLENVGLLMGIAPSIAAPTRVSQCDITGGPRASDYMCPNQPGQAFTCNTPFWDPPNSIFLFRGIGREDPVKLGGTAWHSCSSAYDCSGTAKIGVHKGKNCGTVFSLPCGHDCQHWCTIMPGCTLTELADVVTSTPPPPPPPSTQVQMLTAALSHTWIEVSHCSFMTLMSPNYPDLSYPEDCKSDPTHVCKSEATDRYHNQAWLYRTTGSGNYFNVGRTMAFNYHSDAVQHFFKRGCAKEAKYGKRRGITCVNDLIELADRAQQLGFDTLQFLAHDDMRCGNTLLEVMDVRAGADSRSTCMARKGFEHRSRLFAGGYNASRPCACMETDRCLQCSR